MGRRRRSVHKRENTTARGHASAPRVARDKVATLTTANQGESVEPGCYRMKEGREEGCQRPGMGRWQRGQCPSRRWFSRTSCQERRMRRELQAGQRVLAASEKMLP